MIGSLHQVKIVASETYGCVTGSLRACFINFKGALRSVMVVAFACLCASEVNAQTWTGSTPSEANGKTVYLYNVGAKKFLGKSGRWGTEANLNYEGVPFKLTYSSSGITLQSQVKAEGGSTSSAGYLQIMDGTKSTSTHDNGNYFVDRPNASSFTATSKTTTADSKTAYTLKTTTARHQDHILYDW